MEYTKLGRTGLRVSRLCLGTMNFGPETAEKDAFAIMDHAVELGINFLDTANVYGWKKGEGITEQIIGRWLGQGGGRRNKVVLATKVYGEMGDWPNQSKLSALHIRQACEESLRRLQTDHIDLYQMHHIDRDTPWDEIWQALEVLVQQGKIIYVGSSNFAAAIARATGGCSAAFWACGYQSLKPDRAHRRVEVARLRGWFGLIPGVPWRWRWRFGSAGAGRKGGAVVVGPGVIHAARDDCDGFEASVRLGKARRLAWRCCSRIRVTAPHRPRTPRHSTPRCTRWSK